jgi:hypothetical protein
MAAVAFFPAAVRAHRARVATRSRSPRLRCRVASENRNDFFDRRRCPDVFDGVALLSTGTCACSRNSVSPFHRLPMALPSGQLGSTRRACQGPVWTLRREASAPTKSRSFRKSGDRIVFLSRGHATSDATAG